MVLGALSSLWAFESIFWVVHILELVVRAFDLTSPLPWYPGGTTHPSSDLGINIQQCSETVTVCDSLTVRQEIRHRLLCRFQEPFDCQKDTYYYEYVL